MTRRFVTAPDGRAMGEYGSSASDVRAEFIWMNPEVGDPRSGSGAGTGMFGGDDGLGGYMPIALATAASGGGTTLNWVHGDHLGTPILITDASGTAIPQPGGYTTPAFPGQSRTLVDLYYNRYRDYDPSTGRYIQADPIGLAGGPSPYSYAMGNPLRYTDPMGLHSGTRPWGIPVPVYGPSEQDTQAAKQLGDALGGLRDWICRHSLICQYFNPPAEVSGSRYCPTSSLDVFYRDRGGRSGGGGRSNNPSQNRRDGWCEAHHEAERQQCKAAWQFLSTDGLMICNRSAFVRYSECLSRGGPHNISSPLNLPFE